MKVHANHSRAGGGGLPSVPAASTVGISNPSYSVALSDERDARDARSDVEPQRELTLVEEVEHRPHGKERPRAWRGV
jgi:hypothetical protein